MKATAKSLVIITISLFVVSLAITPSNMENIGFSNDTAENSFMQKQTVVSDDPDNYTKVVWNQGTSSEEFQDSWEHSRWLFGPSVT